jgi:hypothetical protein
LHVLDVEEKFQLDECLIFIPDGLVKRQLNVIDEAKLLTIFGAIMG